VAFLLISFNSAELFRIEQHANSWGMASSGFQLLDNFWLTVLA
jgi:hypothetical protein